MVLSKKYSKYILEGLKELTDSANKMFEKL